MPTYSAPTDTTACRPDRGRRTAHDVCLLLLAALSVVVFGCKPAEKLGRIGGKVTFQEQPVSEGMVVFSCVDKGVNMTGPLKADGTYEIIMAKGAGLPLGTYKVCVSPPLTFVPIGEAAPQKAKNYPNIPKKYRNLETSGLTVTVKDGENRFDISMKP
jgi:hypothetical protein